MNSYTGIEERTFIFGLEGEYSYTTTGGRGTVILGQEGEQLYRDIR